MHRTQILTTADALVTGERNKSYGNFRDQMVSIAGMFNALYNEIEDAPHLDPRHVAIIMLLLKQRRIVTGGDIDSIIDLCGYAALNGEFFIDTSENEG